MALFSLLLIKYIFFGRSLAAEGSVLPFFLSRTWFQLRMRRIPCQKEKSSGVENEKTRLDGTTHEQTIICRQHSRLQRPRSFWSAPRIATSGHVRHRKSAIHRLPVTLRMLRVKSDKSDWFWSQSTVLTKPGGRYDRNALFCYVIIMATK